MHKKCVLSLIHSARLTILPGNDHSATLDHYSHLKIDFSAILKSTDDMYENSDHYQPRLWVGLVDQYFR